MRRHRWLGWLVVGLSGLMGGSGCGASNRPAAAAVPPQRIVSLTLATDEMLLDLVSPDRIAGVTFLVDDPEISNVAGRYPRSVPRLRDTDSERILALKPDLVCVASYNALDFVELLERSGLSLYRNGAVNAIDEVEAGIRTLGERVGEPDRARELVVGMRTRRQQLAERFRDLPRRPRLLFWSAGFTAGRGSTIDDVIREAGGTNVAAELDFGPSAEISPERMLAADPDGVLLCGWAGDDRPNRLDNHPILQQLRAVRMNRVIVIEGRYLTSVSQYVVEGVEQLARRLHPDRFERPRHP